MKKQRSIIYFTLLALLLTIGMACYWYLDGEKLPTVLEAAASILLAGLPIPLWLTGRLPLARGTARAGQADIELETPAILADIHQIDTLVVAKSGVITEGKPYIAALIPEGVSQGTLLALAASAERDATHPVGQVIYNTALERHLRVQPLAAFNEIPGCGVEALVNRTPLRVGTPEWLQKEGVDISAELLTKADQLSLRGQLPVFVANGKYCRGIIALDDEIPQNTITSLHKLQRQKLNIIMLTSTNKRLASAVIKQTGIDEARHGLSIEDKAREVQLLKAHGAAIAMIGKDSSDEAAMTEADLTIQLGASAPRTGDPAKDIDQPQPASIVLKSGLLWDFATLIAISDHTMDIIHQNRIIAVIAWLMLLPPAMGLLHAFGGPFLPPFGALAGQILAAVLIIGNSLRA